MMEHILLCSIKEQINKGSVLLTSLISVSGSLLYFDSLVCCCVVLWSLWYVMQFGSTDDVVIIVCYSQLLLCVVCDLMFLF